MTATASPALGHKGFTLVEVAIVLAILGILIGSLLIPLPAQIAQRRTMETKDLLDQTKAALLGFAAARGRLPCPAIAASNGQESFNGAAGGSEANGACATFWDGFVPAATLGLTPTDGQGFLLDPWNQRIRYAITTAGTSLVPNAYARNNGVRDALAQAGTLNPDLKVCASATGIANAGAANAGCGTATALTTRAVVVVWSLGPNGATGGNSDDEAQNPNPNSGVAADPLFVSHEPAPTFDDVVSWLSENTLFNRLVAAGRVP